MPTLRETILSPHQGSDMSLRSIDLPVSWVATQHQEQWLGRDPAYLLAARTNCKVAARTNSKSRRERTAKSRREQTTYSRRERTAKSRRERTLSGFSRPYRPVFLMRSIDLRVGWVATQ